MPSPHEGILDLDSIDHEAAGGEKTTGGGGLSLRLDRFLGSALSPKMNMRRLRFLFWPRHQSSSPSSEKQLRPTAYLDGVRGFAAFLVYWHHHTLWAHWSTGQNDILENAFGFNGEFHFATFHGVRNFFTGGHMAVAVFYVISGYVLSAKPLHLIQSGEHARVQVGDNLASALFRRWFRLYIPLIVTTFVYITSWHVFGIWNSAAPPKDTYGEEVWNWYAEFKNFSFVFNGGQLWPSYNQHLWSIPLEMKGSIITYTALLSLSRATTKARLWCEVGLIFYFLYIADGYFGALFVSGMLQCDLDLLAKRPDGGLPDWMRRLEPYKKFIYWHFIIIGLYLSGVPCEVKEIEKLRANPGWYYLSFLKPQAVFDQKWFYLFIAANMLISAVPRMPWIKAFFETRFCQYLGRISFSLYLVHGPILLTVGDRLYHAVGFVRPFLRDQQMLASWINIFPLSKTGPLGLEVAFLVPHIILLPLTLWLSDVVTRTVDEPSVKIAAWMYKKVQTYGGEPPEQPQDPMRMA